MLAAGVGAGALEVTAVPAASGVNSASVGVGSGAGVLLLSCRFVLTCFAGRGDELSPSADAASGSRAKFGSLAIAGGGRSAGRATAGRSLWFGRMPGDGITPVATQAAAPPAVPTQTVAIFASAAAPAPRVPPLAATLVIEGSLPRPSP
ncbi:MAG: hypothetical protein IPK93_03735 [Solirubrobacterales bacterium]|nr:hypothetical protein [Solirubrobacterales bacterium]